MKATGNCFYHPLRLLWLLVTVTLIAICALAVRPDIDPVVTTDHGPNALTQQEKPYVILVSLDGFRYDYAQRYGAVHLESLAARGASAPQGMIPAYPPLTRPNHHTIATGLYPEHHGIVANVFYDPQRRERFLTATSADGSWYGGVPLWVLAEREGMLTACSFWPGAQAEIAGMRPTYNTRSDDWIPDERRIEQVVAWLRLPPERRPHLIMLYYSNVDHAGHKYGTESRETAGAVRYVDSLIGSLVSALDPLGLPINIFVVSDHGMENSTGDWVDLDEYADLSQFETAGSLLYPPDETAAASVYQQLRGASDKFVVFRRSQVPANLHFSSNPRIGDPVVVPSGPFLIRLRAPRNLFESKPRGRHTYDLTMLTMRAIFYAAGPDIRPGARVAPFENVHIYPLIAKILDLRTEAIDGDLRVLQGILRTSDSRK